MMLKMICMLGRIEVYLWVNKMLNILRLLTIMMAMNFLLVNTLKMMMKMNESSDRDVIDVHEDA